MVRSSETGGGESFGDPHPEDIVITSEKAKSAWLAHPHLDSAVLGAKDPFASWSLPVIQNPPSASPRIRSEKKPPLQSPLRNSNKRQAWTLPFNVSYFQATPAFPTVSTNRVCNHRRRSGTLPALLKSNGKIALSEKGGRPSARARGRFLIEPHRKKSNNSEESHVGSLSHSWGSGFFRGTFLRRFRRETSRAENAVPAPQEESNAAPTKQLRAAAASTSLKK